MSKISKLREKYGQLRDRGQLHGSIKRAVALRLKRDENYPLLPAVGKWLHKHLERKEQCENGVVIPLGALDGRRLRTVASRDRRKTWRWEISGRENGQRKSGSNSDKQKKSTFNRDLITRSVATCADRKVCLYSYSDEPAKQIKAPAGYHWGVDDHGLCLIESNTVRHDKYHPSGSDLLWTDPPGLARVLRETNATRRRVAAEEKQTAEQRARAIRRAEREGATVCLADSLRAGNCRAGTESWARSHKLDTRCHYTPSQLLALTGEPDRVALVVTVALRRHKAELARGYALLAEHQVG
jgi:hypothetical protein